MGLIETITTGRTYHESDYLVKVVTLHGGIFIGLMLLFLIGFGYCICRRKTRKTPVWAIGLSVVTSIVIMSVAFSYSFTRVGDHVAASLRAFFPFVAEIRGVVENVTVALSALALNPYEACTGTNLATCQSTTFYTTAANVIGTNGTGLVGTLTDVRKSLDQVLLPSLQKEIDDILTTMTTYLLSVEIGLYSSFVLVCFLTCLSAYLSGAFKKRHACALHTLGIFLAFIILLMSAGTLLGSVFVADVCTDQQATVKALVNGSDLDFYFNCNVNATNASAYSPRFQPLIAKLAILPVAETVYDFLCLIGSTLGHCTQCNCNTTVSKYVVKQFGSVKNATGIYGLMKCKRLHQLLHNASDAVCELFVPMIGVFFLLVSLMGHALFLFYFTTTDEH